MYFRPLLVAAGIRIAVAETATMSVDQKTRLLM